ncbi:hypothetical protein [Azospirillum sp. B4]|nr:hypothetical protein [Azospirillum sp. B4]
MANLTAWWISLGASALGKGSQARVSGDSFATRPAWAVSARPERR